VSTRKLKVYGGTLVARGKMWRVIMACRSFKEFHEHTRLNRNDCDVTANTPELAAALARPCIVLAKPLDDYHAPFQKYEP
jgi:hypothetical protein